MGGMGANPAKLSRLDGSCCCYCCGPSQLRFAKIPDMLCRQFTWLPYALRSYDAGRVVQAILFHLLLLLLIVACQFLPVTFFRSPILPKSIAKAAEEHNYRPRPREKAGAALKEVLGATASTLSAPGGSSAASSSVNSRPKAARSTNAGGMLVPPQLQGRRNVTTEDLSNMRTAKRHKPG